MTVSKRLAERKVDKFDKNIIKRGSVLTKKSKKNYPVGPIMIGFFVFVVIGSYNKDGYKRGKGLTTN